MTTRLGSRRSLLAATCAAAAATAALTAAGPGAAQTPPASLHLVAKVQRGVGFMPKGAPHQGSMLGFGNRVSGDDTGYGRAVCTFMAKQQGLLCTFWLHLSKGTMTAQGEVPERANGTIVAITGGTGAYDGVRGTATTRDVNATTTTLDLALEH